MSGNQKKETIQSWVQGIFQGDPGPQGPKGDKGNIGPRGPQGLKGEKGDTGPQGPQGLKGDKGDIGSQGPQGLKGDKGDIGPQGPQGLKGDKGDIGLQGPQGLKGDKGDIGPQGAQGLQGPQGSKGAKGAPGPQGLSGPGAMLVFSFDQGDTLVDLPYPTQTPKKIMTLNVNINDPVQKVKLDATISTRIIPASDSWEFTIKYELKRHNGIADTVLLSDYVSGEYHRQPDATSIRNYFWQSNFTFVDIPGVLGTYTYRIDATVEFIQKASANVANRGFTATVF